MARIDMQLREDCFGDWKNGIGLSGFAVRKEVVRWVFY